MLTTWHPPFRMPPDAPGNLFRTDRLLGLKELILPRNIQRDHKKWRVHKTAPLCHTIVQTITPGWKTKCREDVLLGCSARIRWNGRQQCRQYWRDCSSRSEFRLEISHMQRQTNPKSDTDTKIETLHCTTFVSRSGSCRRDFSRDAIDGRERGRAGIPRLENRPIILHPFRVQRDVVTSTFESPPRLTVPVISSL